MNQAVMFSSEKMDWGTPPELFAELNAEFGFTIDLAARADNTLCPRWIGPGSPIAEDLFTVDILPDEIGYINPEYGRGIGRFVSRVANSARLYGTRIVALLPSRTDTRWFHGEIWDAEQRCPHPWVSEIRFLRGRIKFAGATHGAPFPSMIVVFGPSD